MPVFFECLGASDKLRYSTEKGMEMNRSIDESLQKIVSQNRGQLTVSQLPANWVDEIWKIQLGIHKKNGSRHGDSLAALAIAIASGCTSVEMARGIHLKVIGHQNLEISVAYQSNSDQAMSKEKKLKPRSIILASGIQICAASDYLVKYTCGPQQIGNSYIFSYKADRLHDLVEDLSEKYLQSLPKKYRSLKITPQCFRHQLCANLCASGLYDPYEIAYILGLSQPRSLKNYALASNTQIAKQRFIKFADVGGTK